MATDFYKILGLERNATADAIKAAYRKLARKYHPDLNPNDSEAKRKFQEINEAHEVLSDPENRKKYDAYGEHWKHGEEYEQARKAQASAGRSSGRGGGSPFEGGSGEDYSDLFGSMFGGGGGRQVKFRGQDYQAGSNLDLVQALHTHKQMLTVNGKQIRITVPAGVENGQTIKIPGHGGPGVNGGPHGDLYITFRIADHPRFKRVGNDLHTAMDVDLFTALLGGEITLGTLEGSVKLSVKPETQNGTKVRLKGKGFPVYKQEGVHGDMIVTLNVKLPTGLSERQRELLRELQNSQP
ncbi:MAG: J domain-containing protein [Flavobacteriales bacterium]|jgi:curved DNA-binding protein|nr:J domain-containing protein [Flavobacteriales bacterium]MBK6752659.1 J domain-containing protein [Flavobacteriales bacterium]MBK7270727.1 J domain-containing protein [Flavobacteriales bacterium]MBK9075997.1 J domain-containing protein [Flavobacteriales bacterium]MBK9537231.1 J domain-containing protein [Flavobacteriales bacterium]